MEAKRDEIESRDGTLIPVWTSGEGSPLVLVHGALVDHTAWDAARAKLEAHFTVVAIDRRSTFGDPPSRYELEREFEDVAAVAAKQGGQVDVLGHSSGAICALGGATLMPNLRRLVLYEPPLLTHMPPVLERMEQLVSAGDMEGRLELFFRDAGRLAEATVAGMKTSPAWQAFIPGTRFLLREQQSLAAWQADPERLRSLEAPTLLMVGGATPPEHHHRGYVPLLRDALPNLQVKEIPGQEHFAHRQAPEPFSQAVLDFLIG